MYKKMTGRKKYFRLAACVLAVLLAVTLFPLHGAMHVRAEGETETQTESPENAGEEVFLIEEEPEEASGESTDPSADDASSQDETEVPENGSEEEFIIEEAEESTDEDALPGEDEQIPAEEEEDRAADEAEADADAEEEETDLFSNTKTADLLNGFYSASLEQGKKDKKVCYEFMLRLKNGAFRLDVHTTADSMDYDDTESIKGTYTATDKGIEFTSRIKRIDSAAVKKDGSLTVSGSFSPFLQENTKVVFEEIPHILSAYEDDEDDEDWDDEDEDDSDDEDEDWDDEDSGEEDDFDPRTDIDTNIVDENGLRSGCYSLTEESYDESAALKPRIDVLLDVESGDFYLIDEDGMEKGTGIFLYDPDLARYIMTYDSDSEEEEDTEEKTTAFALKSIGIEFLTPLYIGDGMINTKDSNGNFLTYTAFYSGGEITPTSGSTSGPKYQFTAGANGTFTYGQAKSYTIRVEDQSGGGNEYDKFESLWIDGLALDEDLYDVSEGSLIAVISADRMKTLTIGNHTISVNFSDGSVYTTLTVSKASGTVTTTVTPTPSPAPKTGDPVSMSPYLLLMAAACAGIIASRRKLKK